MPPDESADCVQLLRFGATAVSQHQQILPELAGLVIALHVYWRRFGAADALKTSLTPALRMRATPRYHQIVDQFAFDFSPTRRVYSVSELNAAIRAALENEFPDVWVSGEISGVKLATSGHYYFTLKEAQAQVRAVAFRSAHRYWKIKPQDGLAVLARGRIDVFEARGEYQLIVELLEPLGHGALQLAFEQLKKKLAEEGLFEPSRKRPLPRYPPRIGIVTSRRLPGRRIRLFPALVQGEGSVEEVCRGLDYFNRNPWAELVIVARGGGSLEDLWTFNEEAVARAIARCAVPD